MSTDTAEQRAGRDWTPDGNLLREALLVGERPRRPGAPSASLTFAWRAILKIKHVPEQLFDVTIGPVIFLLMFTFLFGGAIAGNVQDYLHFVLPGVLVQSVLITTVYTGFTLNTDITKGVFDRFRSLPVWQPSPLVGAMLGDAARYVIASVVTVTIGVILGFRGGGGVPGAVAAVALLVVFASSIAWIFTIFGLKLRTPNAVMGVSMMVLFPLTFMSNVFVDPSTMPSGLQTVVEANPVSHLVTAIRGLMYGTPELTEVLWVLLAAALVTAVFAPITMRMYRTRT